MQRLIIILSIALLCGPMCINVLSVEPTDLMAYWSFDKDGGKTVADDSGNKHEGKVLDAVWDKAGKSGGAMSFKGKGDYVEVTNDPTLDPGKDNWTIELWLKRSNIADNDWQKIITKYPGAYTGYRLGLNPTTSGIHCIFGEGEASKVEFITTTAIKDTDWHHIAAVFDRSGDAVIYIDGIPDVTKASIKSIKNVTTDKNIDIGRCWWCGGGTTMGFQGNIDEIKLWRSALTKDEVKQAMDGLLSKIAVSTGNIMTATWGYLKKS